MKQLKPIIAALFLISPFAANADFVEGFESYTAGTVLDNVGGWAAWDGISANAGVVTGTRARTGSNSIQILPDVDAIYQLSGITSGAWVLTAWQFVVSDVLGYSYFIINSEYNDGGPYNWAVQTEAFVDESTVTDFQNGSPSLPLVTNQWVQLRYEIDLDANTVSSYYDGQLLSFEPFETDGPVEIANIDLYSLSGLVYYDDISLTRVPEPGTLALLGLGLAGMSVTRRKKKV